MSEQLMFFIEENEIPIVETVIEEAVSDAIIFDEQDVVVEALAKYVEMLEADKVDEKFEENLSVLLYPFMEHVFPMFENAASAAARTASRAKVGGKIGGYSAKARTQIGAANAKKMLSKLRQRVGASTLAGKMKSGYGLAKEFLTDKFGKMKNAVSAQLSKLKSKVVPKQEESQLKRTATA